MTVAMFLCVFVAAFFGGILGSLAVGLNLLEPVKVRKPRKPRKSRAPKVPQADQLDLLEPAK